MREQDLDAIIQIYNYYVKHTIATLEEKPLERDAFALKFNQFSKQYPYLVAEKNDEVVGFAYAQPFNPKSAYARTAETTVYIYKEKMGQGIGGALYEELIIASKEMGFEQLISLISLPNASSVKLHQKFGFTTAGQLNAVGYKFEQKVDVLVMQLSLNE